MFSTHVPSLALLAKLLGTMMDIYVCAGKHDQVETLSKRMQLNVVQLNILIKSLGKAGKPDRATAILKSALVESRVKPDVSLLSARSSTHGPSPLGLTL